MMTGSMYKRWYKSVKVWPFDMYRISTILRATTARTAHCAYRPVTPSIAIRLISTTTARKMSSNDHTHLRASELFSCKGLTAVVTGVLPL